MKYIYKPTKQFFKSLVQASKELKIPKAKLSEMIKNNDSDFTLYDGYTYTKITDIFIPSEIGTILKFSDNL